MSALSAQDRTPEADRPDTGGPAGRTPPLPLTVLITDLSTDREENMSDPSARTRSFDGPMFDEFSTTPIPGTRNGQPLRKHGNG